EQGEVHETAELSKDDNDATLVETLQNIKRTQKLYAKELAKKAARQEQEKYNLEKALELQRQFDKREKNVDKGNQAHKIDWNDPTVLRYHALKNRAFPKAEVRKNMVMYLKNQGGYKQSYFKGMKYEDIRPIFERKQKLNRQTDEEEEEVEAQVDNDQEFLQKPSTTKETPKGKAPLKGSKTSKSTSAKEPVEEPIAEVVMDDASEDVVCDDDQPQDTSKPKTAKTPNPEIIFRIMLHGGYFEYWKAGLVVVIRSNPSELKRSKELFKLYRYRSQMNKFSKHNVYSTKILGVKSVSVKKLHGYGHLEEVVVKRANRQLCKFKEGDFVELHLHDIEDMLFLAVQHKLFHLNESDIVDFIVAL
nr:hypothetical protein [Tanacetum cinerariifolium]